MIDLSLSTAVELPSDPESDDSLVSFLPIIRGSKITSLFFLCFFERRLERKSGEQQKYKRIVNASRQNAIEESKIDDGFYY